MRRMLSTHSKYCQLWYPPSFPLYEAPDPSSTEPSAIEQLSMSANLNSNAVIGPAVYTCSHVIWAYADCLQCHIDMHTHILSKSK